jgi:hypothetical protein
VQPHWYLWAFCRLRQAPRAFRLDRIRSATILDEKARDRGLDPTNVELPELINRGILVLEGCPIIDSVTLYEALAIEDPA